MFVNPVIGRLRIRESDTDKMFTVNGVAATVDSEQTAATQVNKLFAIASLSVVGDERATFTVEKVVAQGG